MQRLLKALCLLSLAITVNYSFGQNGEDTAYFRTVNARAEKIVSALHLTDASKAAAVQSIIAQQYVALNNIQVIRDSAVKQAKATIADKATAELRVKTITSESAEQIEQLHKTYIAQLSAKLSTEEVDKVKDGMTYGVLPLTYKAYQDMLPMLTTEQKAQILTWLTEAREHAMDAESSKKKHEWFGKYKGRINNYLSGFGIDMKKEGEAWQKRIKEQQAGQ